jgi:hypothetical protein
MANMDAPEFIRVWRGLLLEEYGKERKNKQSERHDTSSFYNCQAKFSTPSAWFTSKFELNSPFDLF